jgi:hypothetical protein
MVSRLVFGTNGVMANSDHLVGALVITVAVCAMASTDSGSSPMPIDNGNEAVRRLRVLETALGWIVISIVGILGTASVEETLPPTLATSKEIEQSRVTNATRRTN